MNSNSSVAGFALSDILTNVIPGIVVVSPALMVSYLLETPPLGLTIQNLLLAIIVAGYLIGELVEMLRTFLFRVPLPFRQIIYTHTNDHLSLGYRDRITIWAAKGLNSILSNFRAFGEQELFDSDMRRETIFNQTERNFSDEFESQFELELESHSPYTIYSTLLSYMQPRLSAITKRNQMIVIFSQNLTYSVIFATLLDLGYIFQYRSNPQVWPFLALFGIILLFIGLVARFASLSAYPYTYLLFVDYYTDRVNTE